MPQATSKTVSAWRKKFAWLPVRCRNGKHRWLCTVVERDVELYGGAAPLSRIVREYDTPARVIMRALRGDPE